VFEKPAPTVNIRQLPPPGRYVISVSCTKRNGNWTEPVAIATIRIQRPWYLSGWFIGGTLFLVVAITGTVLLLIAYRKANMLQLALKEQEQRVYEEKVQMLINVSHELRTPLTLIMAPLKRIINDKEASGKYSETLGRIYRQSRRMKDMLNMVLDLRKMEVGKNSLKIESTDFNKWLESSIEDIIAEEHAEGIDIVLETDPSITEVDMDVRKCDTVLMNILINAIKHSAIGDTITIRTRLSGEGSVIVSVSDQGPGLRDADMSQLFTNFYQSSHEQYGSGIGLSYSKILIELMGGRIGAQDNEDKGATFWWEIPVTAEFGVTPVKAYLNELLGYDPGEEITVPESRSIDTSGMTLMLVDDNADLLDFLKESLHSEFREILLASSGNKAMKMIESGKVPDLIVSDVNMSDGDGYKLCKEIKDNEKYSHIPVVLLSAHRQDESQNESYKIGAEAFLPKPFEIDTLLELVRNILGRKAEIKKMYLKADNEGSYSSKEEGFILQLNRVIAEHMSDPELDQLVLCRELGMSRAALYNKMKAITGAGAKEYITRIRLEKAKALIETTGLSIVEISEMTGFTSQSYFSTAFKAYTGMTPSQYKKQKASL
jgi:signal transduction histidine kinase/DNA-binding response OmpR family regulator